MCPKSLSLQTIDCFKDRCNLRVLSLIVLVLVVSGLNKQRKQTIRGGHGDISDIIFHDDGGGVMLSLTVSPSFFNNNSHQEQAVLVLQSVLDGMRGWDRVGGTSC